MVRIVRSRSCRVREATHLTNREGMFTYRKTHQECSPVVNKSSTPPESSCCSSNYRTTTISNDYTRRSLFPGLAERKGVVRSLAKLLSAITSVIGNVTRSRMVRRAIAFKCLSVPSSVRSAKTTPGARLNLAWQWDKV